MKEKKLKNIRVCCYVALAFCLVWSVLIASNFIVTFAGSYASAHPIDWSVNAAMKIIVLICHVLGSVALITMCTIAVFNVLKGLRENTVFPRSNEKLLFWIALADFVYLLGLWNFQVLWDDSLMIQMQHSNFITPFFLLFFAFMYKVAADAVEENNLTV